MFTKALIALRGKGGVEGDGQLARNHSGKHRFSRTHMSFPITGGTHPGERQG